MTVLASPGSTSTAERIDLGSLPFRERRWVVAAMILVDIAVLEICLYAGYHLRSLIDFWFPISLGAPVYIGITAGILVLPIAYLIMGLYPGYGLSDVERIRRQVMSMAIVFSSLLVWDYLAQDGTWSRGIMLFTWVLATVALPISFSWLRVLLMKLGVWGTPIAIIGAGDEGEAVIRMVQKSPKLGLVPVAVLDDDPTLSSRTVESVRIFGGLNRAEELAKFVRICAISKGDIGHGIGPDLAFSLPFPHVVILPNISGLQSALVEPRDFAGALGLELKKNLLLGHNRAIKRTMDVVIGVPLLVLVLPTILLLSLLIVSISPGSPIFRQRREGADGRVFEMFKLRSMYPDAERRLSDTLASNPEIREEWLSRFKLRDDPRTLPWIGRFLRRSSLDELPQLLNVVRGEMSIVGPRPFPDYHLEHYHPDFLALRRSVKPGITGHWQVEIRNDGDINIQEQYDTYYIRNWSLWLDFYLLFKTVYVVLVGRGTH